MHKSLFTSFALAGLAGFAGAQDSASTLPATREDPGPVTFQTTPPLAAGRLSPEERAPRTPSSAALTAAALETARTGRVLTDRPGDGDPAACASARSPAAPAGGRAGPSEARAR